MRSFVYHVICSCINEVNDKISDICDSTVGKVLKPVELLQPALHHAAKDVQTHWNVVDLFVHIVGGIG